MLVLDILRYILIFPFVILIVLKYLGLKEKQASFAISPFYFYSMILLTKFVFDGIFTFGVLFIYLLFVFIRAMILVKKEYKTILANRLIRRCLLIYSKTYFIYYIIVCIIGIIRY